MRDFYLPRSLFGIVVKFMMLPGDLQIEVTEFNFFKWKLP
jgi:hypothetical protein